MEQIELIQHWNYFCSLAERLDDTKHYIYHGLQEHNGKRELVHGKVYSDVFKQIIVLSASEFEIMSKALCHKKGVKTKKIGDISETKLLSLKLAHIFGLIHRYKIGRRSGLTVVRI